MGVNNNQSHIMDQISDNIAFTNHWSSHGDLWGQIVHITRDITELSHGFYIWAVNHKEQLVSLVPFMGTLGPFEANLHMDLIESTRVSYHKSQELLAAKTAHGFFNKDKNCWGHHACSYTDYMLQIIDELLSEIQPPQNISMSEPQQVGMGYCDHQIAWLVPDRCDIIDSNREGEGLANRSSSPTNYKTFRDFNIPDKTVGYLALESTDFEFIGPDRPQVNINSTCVYK